MPTPQSQGVNPYAAPKAAVADEARHDAILAGAATAVAGPLGALFWIGYLVLTFMLTIQRCHDFNASGWLSLLALVVLVWLFPVLVVALMAAVAIPAYQSYVKRAQQAEQLRAPSR